MMETTEEPKSKEDLSVAISYLLDHLGYSDQRITERRYFTAKLSFAKNDSTKRILKSSETEKIFIGSRSDGTGLTRLSDTDMLQINHAVICVENTNDVPDKTLVAFKLDYKNTPAGYSQLLLINKGTDERFTLIKYALVCRNGNRYLSSDSFMTRNDDVYLKSKGFIGRNTSYYPRKGPSIPKSVKETYLEQCASYCTRCNLPQQSFDLVRAFPCKRNSLLKSWSQSNKTSKWPSQKMRDVIMTLPMHVVPVGHKTSRNRGNEWRVSFTMAEQYLVRSFNNTQVKLLVLLKLIAKHLLQPISPDITSYIMKHIVFWILAKHPEDEFKEEHLYRQIENSLLFLKISIENGKLFHFIATKRNLFERKIPKTHKTKLLEKIAFLLDNGQRLVSEFLWDENELGKFLIVQEEIEKMAKANVIDKAEDFKTSLLSSKELSDNIVTSFCASHLKLMIPSADFMFQYVLRFWRKGVKSLLNQNLLCIEREQRLKALKEHERRNTFRFIRVNHLKYNSDSITNVDLKETQLLELRSSETQLWYNVKFQDHIPQGKRLREASYILFLSLSIITLFIDIFSSDKPKFLLVTRFAMLMSSAISFYLVHKVIYVGSICKCCGRSHSERKTMSMYTVKGIFEFTMWSKRLVVLFRKIFLIFLIFVFSTLTDIIGNISNGFGVPILLRKVLCAMTENCTYTYGH